MDFIPGFCQGIARVLISYPFDAVKIFSQNNNNKPWLNFKHQIKTNPRVFYRGVGVPAVTISIDRAIQYKFFEEYRTKFNPYLVGAGLGLFSSMFSVPMQFVTTNVLVLPKTEYQSLWRYLGAQLRDRGILSFYKGYTIELPRSALATSVYLGTYGELRDLMSLRNPDNKTSPTRLQTTAAAIGSSWSSWLVVYPLDTIRTVYQLDKQVSVRKVVAQRYQRFGLLSFWRGLTPVLLRTAPSSIIGMIVYESVRNSIAID